GGSALHREKAYLTWSSVPWVYLQTCFAPSCGNCKWFITERKIIPMQKRRWIVGSVVFLIVVGVYVTFAHRPSFLEDGRWPAQKPNHKVFVLCPVHRVLCDERASDSSSTSFRGRL